MVNDLKSELPYYLAAAGGVATTIDWWKGHEHELPHWSAAFKLIALVQPSSAACERVSLLSSSFSAQQESALDQLSVMLQYNEFFNVYVKII